MAKERSWRNLVSADDLLLRGGVRGRTKNQRRPPQASFLITNFVVKVPKDAQTTRIWFAVPQENAY